MRRILAFVLVFLMAALGLSAAAGSSLAAPSAGTIETMSCPSAKTCVGLGYYASPVGGVLYFLQAWDDGHWGPVYGGIPGSGADSFNALSCVSANDCVAVGGAADGAFSVAAAWNGTRWSMTKAPAPASPDPGSFLIEASCATPRFCVALGQYEAPSPSAPAGSEGFIDTWNGTKWTVTGKEVPGSTHRSNLLNGVSCVSAVRCVVVGGSYVYNDTLAFRQDQSFRPIALTWNGRKWTASAAASPGKGHADLADVSCWSAKGCLAVGYYYPNSTKITVAESPLSLAEKWNGARWTITAKPPAPAAKPVLEAVSCWSANGCLAVGSTGSAAGAEIDTLKGLADSWNGRTWKNIHAATPPHGTGSTHGWRNGWELPAVSCATATDCVAFGVAGTLGSFQYLFPFAEFYAGSRLVSVSDS